MRQKLLGNRGDGIELRVGALVDDCQFGSTSALRVIFALAFLNAHVALDLEKLGEKLADQKQDQAEMGEENADFLFAQFEALDMGRDKVHQQQSAQQVTAW